MSFVFAAANKQKTLAVTPHKTMRGHTSYVSGVAHLPGEQRIITCSFDGSLRLWDLESGAQIGGKWQDEEDEAAVRTMALSPNGKTLASGSQDGTVRLWDVETGKVVVKWKGHTEFVESVCWSPNGERVVSGSCPDGTARVWDVESEEPVEGLNPIKTGHIHVYAVSYSPEATMIATGGFNGIEIWDAKTGKRLNKIKDYDDICSLAWTSDEKKLIAALGISYSIRIFNTATWQPIAVLKGHAHVVHSITLFPNDRLLASTSYDGTARLWNLDTNLQVGPPLQREQGVGCAAFSADGKLLSTGCADENAYVWDVQAILKPAGLEDLLSIPDAQKSELQEKANATRRPPIRTTPRRVPPAFFDNAQDHNPSSTTSRLHPDSSLHRGFHAFAPSWGSPPRALLARLTQPFRRSQPNADQPIALQQPLGPSASSRRSPPVVEVPALDDKKARLFGDAFSTAGALYTARRPERASDRAKRIKNPKWWARVVLFLCLMRSPGEEIQPLRQNPPQAQQDRVNFTLPSIQDRHKYPSKRTNLIPLRPVLKLLPSRTPSPGTFISKSFPSPCLCHSHKRSDTSPYTLARLPPCHLRSDLAVQHVVCAERENRLSNTRDEYEEVSCGSVRVGVRKRVPSARSLRGHTDWVQEVVFSKNRNKLQVISTSSDKTVRIWDVETGKQEHSLVGHASKTTGLAVSMDGRRIVSGAKDGKIIVWDADTREIFRCLSHHTDWVICIRFSRDEKRFASASEDGTLKIWDAESGELVFDIDDHLDQVCTVAYSPNGTKIASGSFDQTVRIWNAATGKQQTQPLSHGAAVRSIVWSPDSRRLISACNDGQIYFWSTPTGAQLGFPLRAHSKKINSLAISPDGELIASASVDHTARLWNTSTRKPFGRVLQHASQVGTVAFSPDCQLVATGDIQNTIFLWDISQESIVMTNAVSPSFVSPASNITTNIYQSAASSDSFSASSTPTSDELLDGTEFPSYIQAVGSRDAATSPSPSLPPQGHSHHEIPSPARTSPPVELPDGIRVPPETIHSRDAAPSPSPSFPPQGSSHPQIATASASTPVLASPPKSFWKRFPILNRSAASVDSKRWKFPRIGNIMQRKHRNAEPQAGASDARH
ncbi:WD40 repeat-like protein [Suillus weaverae]|nr:WD40 repeat-like protein [Suillus weaverae]